MWLNRGVVAILTHSEVMGVVKLTSPAGMVIELTSSPEITRHLIYVVASGDYVLDRDDAKVIAHEVSGIYRLEGLDDVTLCEVLTGAPLEISAYRAGHVGFTLLKDSMAGLSVPEGTTLSVTASAEVVIKYAGVSLSGGSDYILPMVRCYNVTFETSDKEARINVGRSKSHAECAKHCEGTVTTSEVPPT